MNKDLLKVSIRQNAIYLPLIEEEKKRVALEKTLRELKLKMFSMNTLKVLFVSLKQWVFA